MSSLAEKYLGFDDRKFILIGGPIIAFLIPIVFFSIYPWEISGKDTLLKWSQSLVYTVIFWIGVRWFTIKVRQRYPAPEKVKLRIFLAVIATVIYTSFVNIVLHIGIDWIFEDLCGDNPDLEPTTTQGFVASFFTVFFVLAIYEAAFFYRQLRESLLEQERFKQAHIRSQLEGLRNQVNPHFLFNSINTLMNMIKEDPDLARDFLAEMAKVYRYLLENREEQLTSLDQELEFLDAYLFLQKERFRGNLSVEIDIPDYYRNWQIVPLSLQMLLENAIKHNVVSKKQPLDIKVFINEEEQLWVVNNYQPKMQNMSSTGLGLNNLKTRYSFFTKCQMEVLQDEHSFSVALPLLSPDLSTVSELPIL